MDSGRGKDRREEQGRGRGRTDGWGEEEGGVYDICAPCSI